jgi:hypothetical protein
MLFLGLFFAQPICAMEKNSQVALTSEFARRFVQAAQEDWNEETKALLKHSNSNAAQSLNRYTQLFVERADKLSKAGKLNKYEDIIKEIQNTFPTQSELRIILNQKASWGQWALSWVYNSDPVCIQQWKDKLWNLQYDLTLEKQKRQFDAFVGQSNNQ